MTRTPTEYVRLTFREAGAKRRSTYWAARTKHPGSFSGRNPDGSTKGTAKADVVHIIIVARPGEPIPDDVRIEPAHCCLRYAVLVVGEMDDCPKCQDALAR